MPLAALAARLPHPAAIAVAGLPIGRGDRRKQAFRQWHRAGVLEVEGTGREGQRSVSADELADVDFALNLLFLTNHKTLANAHVRFRERPAGNPKEQRIKLLGEAWRKAGSPPGMTAAEACAAALADHPEAAVFATTMRTLRRDFATAKGRT